jgi:transcriptional regulator with XRE-family HTH domain
LRYRQDITQKQLADKIGVLQHHLSEMENGKRPIGKAMAKKLAGALNADWRVMI